MAHEITIRTNGRAEMAFTGETPWHGLGQPVTVGASVGVWQREAGMDWTAIEATPTVYGPHDIGYGESQHRIDFPGYKGLYRSDNLEPLAIVGRKYQVVQPKEVLEFFRDLTEGGGWHIHTAGTLRGGRKLWAMATAGQVGSVNPSASRRHNRDEIHNNLLLATSLDGSMKTTAMLTAVRVVCANTLALALREDGQAITISHRTVFDADAIKRALGVALESFDAFMAQAREMADTPISTDEARDVLRNIFGSPVTTKAGKAWLDDLTQAAETTPEELTKDSRLVDQVIGLFDGNGMGACLSTSAGTRWGLFNAVTQHVDHNMGRSADTRLDSAWFGRGAALKAEALSLLTA